MSVYIERASITGFQVVLFGSREELQRIYDTVCEHERNCLLLSDSQRCWVESANPVRNYAGDEEKPEITLFVFGSSMREAIWHTTRFLAANFSDIEFPANCPICSSGDITITAMGAANSRKDDCAEHWCTSCGVVWFGIMEGGDE